MDECGWLFVHHVVLHCVREYSERERKIFMWTTKSIQLNTIRLQLIEFEKFILLIPFNLYTGYTMLLYVAILLYSLICYFLMNYKKTTKCDASHFFPIATMATTYISTRMLYWKIFRKQSVGKLMRSNYYACRTMGALIHICNLNMYVE